jgi:YggT family protein
MTSGYLTTPLVFLIQTLLGLFALVVMLRFLLQVVRADFYNPLSQFVVRVTSPVLRPLRRFIPGYRGLDTAALVLAWLVKSLEVFLVVWILGKSAHPLGALFWSIPELIALTINIFLFAVLIRVVLSWVNPDPFHPTAAVLNRFTDPLLRPAQRLIPPIGGLDLSPMAVMMGLVLLEMLLLPPLRLLTGSPL